MSLINDALKKAQRSRSADAGDVAPVPGGNTRITKRGVPLSAKSILLAATGGFVLFVLAVVGAVYFLNRPAVSPPVAIAKSAPPAVTAAESNVTLTIAPPVIAPPPKAAPEPAPDPAPATPPRTVAKADPSPPAPTKADPAASTATKAGPGDAAAASASKAAATPAADAPVASAMPDERVHTFLDSLHVTAVRRQPTPAIMIGERVFRLNDIVERSLGLRLTKVDDNQITFTDANGVAYVKYF